MRYCKGSTVLSADKDVPLLVHVRNCKFVGYQQLFEFLQRDGVSPSRSAYNWRIRRLLEKGYIEQVEGLFLQGSPVYSIARNGLVELEANGQSEAAFNSGTRLRRDRAHVFHALELNAIRLSLVRKALLDDWKSEVQVEGFNMVDPNPYQKDYDAIVRMWVGDRIREFALEYERTLKSGKRYEKILDAVEAERQVGCILYLTPDPVLLRNLVQYLTPTCKPIGFLTAPAFRQLDLAARVMEATSRQTMTLEQLLNWACP